MILSEKEQQSLQADIKEMISKKLLNGFKNNRMLTVQSIDSINVYDIRFNEELSGRSKLVIDLVYADVRVWVSLQDGSSNDNLLLRNSTPIELDFNEDQQRFIISNEEDVEIINVSPY